MTSAYTAFAVMSTIWGLTWIAIKFGLEGLPPLFFASTRLLAAGAILLLLARARGASLAVNGFIGRIAVAGVLVNGMSYGFLFWGMQYVPSGLASVVNLALIPVGLFTIGLAAGEESYSPRKVAGLVLGVLGLLILFLPSLSFEGNRLVLVGMLSLVLGTLAYCWGSILSRPLLRALPHLMLSGWLNLVGGIALFPVSLAFEPIDRNTWAAFFEPSVAVSWIFIVFGGSIIAFTLYLRLLRDWGPARTGLYAFVSPIIAVILGILVFNESFGLYEVAGSIMMLSASALAMRGENPPAQLAIDERDRP